MGNGDADGEDMYVGMGMGMREGTYVSTNDGQCHDDRPKAPPKRGGVLKSENRELGSEKQKREMLDDATISRRASWDATRDALWGVRAPVKQRPNPPKTAGPTPQPRVKI